MGKISIWPSTIRLWLFQMDKKRTNQYNQMLRSMGMNISPFDTVKPYAESSYSPRSFVPNQPRDACHPMNEEASMPQHLIYNPKQPNKTLISSVPTPQTPSPEAETVPAASTVPPPSNPSSPHPHRRHRRAHRHPQSPPQTHP